MTGKVLSDQFVCFCQSETGVYFGLYLLIVNAAAFLLFGYDKKLAKQQKWRIRERTLFISAIIGGSFGAILGMRVFHHKTRHPQFAIGLPMILLLQIILFCLFLICCL